MNITRVGPAGNVSLLTARPSTTLDSVNAGSLVPNGNMVELAAISMVWCREDESASLVTLATDQVLGDGLCPDDIAVDNDHVYFTISDRVRSVPKTSGPVVEVMKADAPRAVAADSSFVYVGARGAILAFSKTRRSTSTLSVASTPVAIAIDESRVYWLEEQNGTIGRRSKPSSCTE